MKTATKVWLITAASLIVIGCVIFCGVMGALNWDFTKLSTDKYETNRYEMDKEFENITINTDTAELTFALSKDNKCTVECYEEEKAKHSVAVEEGTLVIDSVDSRSWVDHIGINFESPKITVYLPEGEYASLLIRADTGDVDLPKGFSFEDIDISFSTGDVELYASASEDIQIKGSTGDICVENISAGSLDLAVSTGRITVSNVKCEGNTNIQVSTGKTVLTDVSCENLTSGGSTGSITLKKVVATETLSVNRSTGDVRFDSSDAAEIYVKTDTGKVTGSLLTDKIFITQTDTGKVDVPKSVSGGRCEITTDTGDIKITVK